MKSIAFVFVAAASQVAAFAPRAFDARPSTAMNVAVGDSIPSVEHMQGFPDVKKFNVADMAKGKNVILVGLPGAFTPT